jgi:hypothetical protein
MSKILLLIALLMPLPALAHVGHLDEVDGHVHFVAAWALFGAIVGALWLIWVETRAPKRPKGGAKDGGAGR